MIGDILDEAMGDLRAEAESMMRDTVLIEARTGEIRDALGSITKTWSPVYVGRGVVRLTDVSPSIVDSAKRTIVVREYLGKVPHNVTLQPNVEHRLTVTASDDANAIGSYTVIDAGRQSWAIQQRLRLTRSS